VQSLPGHVATPAAIRLHAWALVACRRRMPVDDACGLMKKK
jgi:hypothetical protein